ncbi:dCTP deaminase [Candidatus Legionella polyplacis]|uniref:dCTP deaminase n=1 Tax=Candidatus Legionella polyplacis TaxID=2005262 RepID=A0ABZ2GZX7_9GAMM
MPIKSDNWIKYMSTTHNMINPFEKTNIRKKGNKKIISYGLSSYGYDARCSNEFKIFTNINSVIVDPKNFNKNSFLNSSKNTCTIPPNSFVLTRTIEYFKIPRNILAICIGKSTYARCGIITNITPIEPEWEGHITIELSNSTNLPVKIYAKEGIIQIIFLESDSNCSISYQDKKGKYQKQIGIKLPCL